MKNPPISQPPTITTQPLSVQPQHKTVKAESAQPQHKATKANDQQTTQTHHTSDGQSYNLSFISNSMHVEGPLSSLIEDIPLQFASASIMTCLTGVPSSLVTAIGNSVIFSPWAYKATVGDIISYFSPSDEDLETLETQRSELIEAIKLTRELPKLFSKERADALDALDTLEQRGFISSNDKQKLLVTLDKKSN